MGNKDVDDPPAQTVARQLAPNRYADLRGDWRRAYIRLTDDPGGAVTAARSFVEAVCKAILDATSVNYDSNFDLPKLYSLASKQLGIAASTQTDRIFRSMFGAAHTIVQSIGELRNAAGDAHGKGREALRASPAQAELAVNLAGSVGSFLIATLERHVAATKRLDSEGRAILRFDKSTVWRLRDHAQNSVEWMKTCGEKKPTPALWLVGDAGVYLMSNGHPPISHAGEVPRSGRRPEIPFLTAPAVGCDPSIDEVDDLWPIHNAIEGGDDFVRAIPLQLIERALNAANAEIVIVADLEGLTIYGDTECTEGT